jgi:hypothetical protein
MSSTAEVVKASELLDKVVQRIFEARHPERVSEHKKALAQYKRRLGKRKEVEAIVRPKDDEPFLQRRAPGFWVMKDGQPDFVERPILRIPSAYGYEGYDRSFGFTTHARGYGLLATPRYNRDIRPGRVDEYEHEMKAGRWHDLLSDPIAITTAGDVVNGQHRIAAAAQVDWSEVENDPVFLVVWGVNQQESLYADGSRRTQRDERTIAERLLAE